MMLLEHEAKALLGAAGIATPQGLVVRRGARAAQRASAGWSRFPAAVKVQVRSGGRGKQGGVRRVDDAAALEAAVDALLETSFGGERPEAVLVEPWLPIERELYLGVTVDGRADGYRLMYAPKGGVDIEEGAPPVSYAVGPAHRFRTHELRRILHGVEPDYQVRERVIALAKRILDAATAHDATTIEINPLARLEGGDLVAADAKVVLDDWACFRSKAIADGLAAERTRADAKLRDCLEMQHMYVKLDGDIGLISGGAGMTMAAMDMIAEQGGAPACFLDCSPGPTSTRGYRPAFAMLDADRSIKVILVSIFGGGTQMQRVANAMKEVMADRRSRKPVVFRLDGTHVDQVPGIFAEFGAHNHDTLETAVAEAVELARRAR